MIQGMCKLCEKLSSPKIEHKSVISLEDWWAKGHCNTPVWNFAPLTPQVSQQANFSTEDYTVTGLNTTTMTMGYSWLASDDTSERTTRRTSAAIRETDPTGRRIQKTTLEQF